MKINPVSITKHRTRFSVWHNTVDYLHALRVSSYKDNSKIRSPEDSHHLAVF